MKPRPVILGFVFLLAILALSVLSGIAAESVTAPGLVTARDAAGVAFVKVREASPHQDGEVFDAELWQRADAVGPAQPFYLRLLTPAGSPPMFTRLQ